jgi:hypothetical protein
LHSGAQRAGMKTQNQGSAFRTLDAPFCLLKDPTNVFPLQLVQSSCLKGLSAWAQCFPMKVSKQPAVPLRQTHLPLLWKFNTRPVDITAARSIIF